MVDRWINLLESLSPLIETPRDRRSVIKTFVPDMIEEGINQSTSLRLFQQTGMGIRSSDFADIYNDFLGGNILQSHLRDITDADIIDKDFLSARPNKLDTSYRYVFNLGLSHSENQSFRLGSWSISTNQEIPIGRLRDMAVEEFVAMYGDTFDFVEGAQLVRAYYDPNVRGI